MDDIILRLSQMGPLPPSKAAKPENLAVYEQLLEQLATPVSDEDAKTLVTLFGPDDCFGLAWTLVHLIETAPSWPMMECLTDSNSAWITLLHERTQIDGH